MLQMIRKILALIMVVMIGITNFATSALASDEYYQENSFAMELLQDTTKDVVRTGSVYITPPLICLAVDAIASGFFPPAAALAPYCAATTGIAVGGAIAGKGFSEATKALAH